MPRDVHYSMSYDGGKSFGQLSADQQKALRSWRRRGKKGAAPVSIDDAPAKKQRRGSGAKAPAKRKPAAPAKGIGSYKSMAGLKGAVTRARNGGASDERIAERLKAKGVEGSVLEKLGLAKGERKEGKRAKRKRATTAPKRSSRAVQADLRDARREWQKLVRKEGGDPDTVDAESFLKGELDEPGLLRGAYDELQKLEREASQYAAPKSRIVRYSAFGGGNYAAKKQSDGTWTIYNVPIFAEHERNGVNVDKAWLEAAVRKDQARRAEHYKAPVHIEHTGGSTAPARAGHFELTRVGRDRYEGAERYILYANIVGVPDATFQRMKRGELPYRSPEVHDLNDPEINSLALMESEVPYFRFPLLTLREDKGERVAAYSATGEDGQRAYRVVYRCQSEKYGDDMNDPTKYEDGGAPDIASKLDAILERLDRLEGMEREEQGELAGEGEMTASEAEDMQMDAEADMAEAEDDDISDAELDAMLDEEDDPEEYGAKGKRNKASPAEMYQARSDAQMQSILSRLKKAEGEIARYKARDDRREWTAKAQRELRDHGIDYSEIAKYAAKSAEVREVWLDTVKQGHGVTLPPKSGGSYTASEAAADPAIAKYAASGDPVKYRRAQQLAREYDSIPNRTQSRERFIEMNMQEG